MKKLKHPTDKAARRSAEAKALEHKIFHQKKINKDKRVINDKIKAQETQDELQEWVSQSHHDVPVGGYGQESDRDLVADYEDHSRLRGREDQVRI